MDAKATVKVGPFARGGKSRALVAAVDHDFHPAATLTPVGIFLPTFDELFVYGVTSKVTSDCLVDRLVQWWESVRARFAHITTLVLNVDNGPENHSRRTQFMQRMVEFVPAVSGDGASRLLSAHTTASTTRLSGAGASWKTIGMAHSSIRLTRCCSLLLP